MNKVVGQEGQYGGNYIGDYIGVGITGHRSLAAIDGLVESIEIVLDQIERHWPGLSLTAISSLAEGSDRLVVERILARPNAKLIVPLPMAEEEYLRDFASQHSKDEFLQRLARAHTIVRFPPVPTRPAAYEMAGRYIIEHCQVLVAIWNGEPPQGEGGTGAVVALARSRRHPLAWIHAENGRHGQKPDSPPNRPSTGQGTITYENLSLPAHG